MVSPKQQKTPDRPLRRLRLVWLSAGVVGCAGIVVVWLLLIATPMRLQCQQLEQQLADAKQLLNSRAEIEEQLVACRHEADHWQEEYASIRAQSAASYDLAEFLHWTHQQAEDSQLAIRDFRPAGRDALPGYEAQRVSFSGQGSYPAVCEFLERLRHIPRMHRITNVEISPRNEEGTICGLTVQILMLSHVDPKRS